MGLVNRVVETGEALAAAQELAAGIAVHPQACLRHDRLSLLEQAGMTEPRGPGQRAAPRQGPARERER